MDVTFLGTGGSFGNPVIGCGCPVCTSSDIRDVRLRTSLLLETESTRVLIDCGPDFRRQILGQAFRRIDGILVTHTHYDHVAGIDDVRPFCKFGNVDIYADRRASDSLHHTIPYCFKEQKYPGVPQITLHEIVPHKPFAIGDIEVVPIRVMHGSLPILGFRFGTFAYITDMKTIQAGELSYLCGVETLVVNALRFDNPHHAHQLVGDAVSFSRGIGAKHTYFVHSCHHIGLHAEVNKKLPEGFELAYDGQKITV